MIELIAHNLAPIMFVSMALFLLFGYPIAFALAANGLLFFVIGVELTPYAAGQINLNWNLLGALPQRLFGIMSNELFLAIPFFTFMGIVLERSGMAEDLLDTIGQLFGPVRGGLAYAVVIVGALLAATTGVVAASVIAMGLISLPIMLRYNYDRRLATGVIAASGTLAQIIPPSLVLIVLASQLGVSVGNMYRGALLPALMLTGIYMVYILALTIIRPDAAPSLPPEARRYRNGTVSLIVTLVIGALIWAGAYHFLLADNPHPGIYATVVAILALSVIAKLDAVLKLNLLSVMAREVIMVLIPPLSLVFLVLGTIFIGVATPTEGGAMGAVGAVVLAAMKGRLNYPVVQQALHSTVRLSSFVMFILIGATVFSLTFYGVNGQKWVKDLLLALPGGETGFLIVVATIIFFLAFFLDFFELAFVIVPLLAPVARELGIDMVWFGVILGVVMQTSFLTPPVGFALFYLRSVAAKEDYDDPVTKRRIPRITTLQIYRGAVPFVMLQVVMIGVVIAWPQLVMRYKGPPIDRSNVEYTIPTQPGGGGGFGGFGGFQPQGGAPGGFAPPAAPDGGAAAPAQSPAPGGFAPRPAPNFGAPADGTATPAPTPAPGGFAPRPAPNFGAAPAPAPAPSGGGFAPRPVPNFGATGN
ncbi:MAG: TRAP transporter large permease subunit [Paracoccus sp. (in: a-proteobacteria)]|nr:TRAP transporter large permease subunit [Paracoccus sp. (in: a-proteobacteria)]